MSSGTPEAFLAWIWEARRVRSPLHTTDGATLHVVYPGWRWGSWGPDFHDALLALDGRVLRGDVEIHVDPRDWQRHGHAGDPAYARTVLHVALDAGADFIAVRADGAMVPTLALADHLAGSIVDLLTEWRTGDAGAVSAACLSPDLAAPALAQAGLEWFRAKTDRFEGDLSAVDPAQALWSGLLEALGYERNASAFRRLAARLTVAEALGWAQADGALPAVLFHEAGLRPAQRGMAAEDPYNSGPALASAPPVPLLGWSWVGGRPANQPPRRVAAAAALVTERPGWPSAAALIGRLRGAPARAAAASLRRALERAGDPYWRTHADFGRPLPRPCAVLGPSRAAVMVVAVVLPWIAALGRVWGMSDLVADAERVFRAHPPLPGNRITRHMAAQVVDGPGRLALGTACQQQGLLHLYRAWCRDRHCDLCPAGVAGAPPAGVGALPSVPELRSLVWPPHPSAARA